VTRASEAPAGRLLGYFFWLPSTLWSCFS
jgi:hypothetical protein